MAKKSINFRLQVLNAWIADLKSKSKPRKRRVIVELDED